MQAAPDGSLLFLACPGDKVLGFIGTCLDEMPETSLGLLDA